MREQLLTRHFVQRFLENDLISPDADRHEVLALVCATLISSALFVTIVLSTNYLFRPFQSPGWTVVTLLGDSFLFVACSMIVMALVAVAEWDALTLDARDTAILGLLPVPRRVIVRAKLKALGLFAAAFAVALNLAPSLLHPSLAAAKLPMPAGPMVLLIAGHAVSTMAAGLFGFVAVLGIREFLYAVLSPAAFRRAAVVVQGTIVVVLIATLLLLPQLSSGIARSSLTPGAASTYAMPPLWFVGLQDTIGGRLIDDLPRGELPFWARDVDEKATSLYRSRRPVLQKLAWLAVANLALAIVAALSLYLWNTRRLPTPAPRRRRQRRWWTRTAVRLLEQSLVRRPAVQAGFFFTLQTLSRSVPHRVSIATSMAIGVAAAAVGIGGVAMRTAADREAAPLVFLAAQAVIVLVLVAGFRNSVRVPAQLRANWIFHMAWSGDERPYVAGVKRAALLAVAIPVLLALFPIHALVVGWSLAATHLAYGLALAVLVTELAFLGFRKLPFASSFVPSGTLASSGAVYALLFGVIVYALAWIERLVLGIPNGTLVVLGVAAAVLVALRAADVWQHRTPVPVELDEVADPPTQRLGLSG